MPRVRYHVALLAPAPHAAEIEGLRRACAPERAGASPPHITLVPPVNVPAGGAGAALAVLREAAPARARSGPLRLVLGPPACFHPVTETLYLEVHDPPGQLRALRRALFRPPLDPTVDLPYVPHLTLATGITEARARAAIEALADYTVTVVVERVHLLAQEPAPPWRWVPVADAPFESPAVVGRGGVELELHRSHLADPEVTELAGAAPAPPPGAGPLVLAARRRGVLVGAALGWVYDGAPELAVLVVAEDQRGQGIGRQLRLAFAADRR